MLLSLWKGKSMTEKSEDQVVCIWVCSKYKECGHESLEAKHQAHYNNDDYLCTGTMIQFIPHSKYLALKSDLATAVEALTSLVGHTEATLQFPHKDKIDLVMSLDRAKAALGKIGGGK